MRRPQDTRPRNQKFDHKGSYGAQRLNANTKGARAQELLRAYAEKKKKSALPSTPPEPTRPAAPESAAK